MPKLDLEAIPRSNATGYPAEFARAVKNRWYRRLAPVAGLTDFGVSQVMLQPGAWSAQRHWHENEDEFLVMISGAAVLVDDSGRIPLVAGDCAAFAKGDGNGHCVINESQADCVFIVVGQAVNGECHYPDIDMHLFADGRLARRDGSDF
jgi:uncharacterized cupin superfamily protein